MHTMQATPPKHIILYADDDEDDLLLLQEAFLGHASNVEMITVSNGMDALRYLEESASSAPSPCLIILDVNMPRLNGKETLERIRHMKRYADTPVVLFTTSSLPWDKTFAEKYKAGFVTKPIDSNQMAVIADLFMEHCSDEIKKAIRQRLV